MFSYRIKADVVFEGKISQSLVRSVSVMLKNIVSMDFSRKFHFDVIKVAKGLPPNIKKLSIGTSSGSCGVLALDGEMNGEDDYIIFAKLNSPYSYPHPLLTSLHES